MEFPGKRTDERGAQRHAEGVNCNWQTFREKARPARGVPGGWTDVTPAAIFGAMSSYCDYAPGQPFHGDYHEREYGFPLASDADLFGRLVLEINQAGLSWLTILKKKDAFAAAYHGFDIDTVADYGEADRARLLADAGIIRNRLKVDAAIANARRIRELRSSHGSFRGWLDAHHPLPLADWVRLFRKTFRFTGGEIVNEFLMSTGYLPGAHRESCPVYARVLLTDPPWRRVAAS